MAKLKNIKISQLLASERARNIFIILGLGAVFLIFLTSQFGTSEAENPQMNTDVLSAHEYCTQLTDNTKAMIEGIEGAGETMVFITLDASYEYVYLEDDKTLSKVVEPKVRGVAVLCKGGEDPVVKEQIALMLKSLFSLGSDKISIGKLI